MKELIKGTTAYKIFSSDRLSGKLSHAYLLQFGDPFCLRAALKIFAREFFSDFPEVLKRVEDESFSDFTLYPPEGKKIAVDGISEIISDSALKPVECDKKLYVIDGFDGASALVQNKLLKTLEDPLPGVHFLLGAQSLAPVLPTVLSRVKLLTITPFSQEEIYAALERSGKSPLNLSASESCNGVFGVAKNMVSGGWFTGVKNAAEEIFAVKNINEINPLAIKYGDMKYKQELLSELRAIYFAALTGGRECKLDEHVLIFALEELDKAFGDLKFNAYFQGLLYDFMLKVVTENERWQKLQA